MNTIRILSSFFFGTDHLPAQAGAACSFIARRAATMLLSLAFALPAWATTYTFQTAGSWTTASNWSTGTVPPLTLPAGDQITIDANCTFTLTTTNQVISGALTINSGKTLTLAKPGVPSRLFNIVSGTFTIQSGGTFTTTGFAGFNNQFGAVFINDGTFNLGRTFNQQAIFTNNGTINLTTANSTFFAGYMINNGAINVSNGIMLAGSTEGTFVNSAGATITVGVGRELEIQRPLINYGTITNNGIVNNNSGTITNLGTFSNNGTYRGFDGIFNGSLFTNPPGGTVSPGNGFVGHCLTFSNGFINEGILNITIFGETACSEFAQVNVTGTATLGGTLSVNFLFGFEPSNGQTFQILNAGSFDGSFSTITVPPGDLEHTYANGLLTFGTADGCPEDPNKTEPGICGCGVADTDTDGDGTPDCNDDCPNDPEKIAPGQCGCGVQETDTDQDGTPDCNDDCPMDPEKIDPGTCGCGVQETDTDQDGTPDCNDDCPNDPEKIAPGQCGCGVQETDTDGDGTPDCNDDCPMDPEKIAPGQCGCGVPDTDNDGDGVANCYDNCDNTSNPNQADSDGDGQGNACDTCPNDPENDADNDGICGNVDNCPSTANPNQADLDQDGIGDACDATLSVCDALDVMATAVNNSSISSGLKNALNSKLNNVKSKYQNGQNNAAVNQLNAFINQVQAQSGNGIPSALANAWIANAQAVIAAINSGNSNCNGGGQNLIVPGGGGNTPGADIQLEAFPNPAGSLVNIQLRGIKTVAELTVYDQFGKEVWTEQWKEGQISTSINLESSRFCNGIYLVSVSSEGERLTQRLVIIK